MSEEEKEAINKVLKEQIDSYEKYYVGSEEILPNISEDYKMSKTILNYIERLQKELEEKTTILMAGADKVKQLEKENQELKERNKYQYELLGKFEKHIDKETIMKIYDEE